MKWLWYPALSMTEYNVTKRKNFWAATICWHHINHKIPLTFQNTYNLINLLLLWTIIKLRKCAQDEIFLCTNNCRETKAEIWLLYQWIQSYQGEKNKVDIKKKFSGATYDSLWFWMDWKCSRVIRHLGKILPNVLGFSLVKDDEAHWSSLPHI